ncbi:hypothetical protein Gpo141_00010353 [Globisporangium polare]
MTSDGAAQEAKLPLHPRKAQQVFFELIQWKTELTPQIAMTSLSKRIQHVQEQYLAGVYEAKRGQEFDCRPSLAADKAPQRVVLRLTRDGSALQLLQATEEEDESQLLLIKSVKLVDIQRIGVLSPPELGFRLQICDPGSNQNDAEHQDEPERTPALLFTLPTELAASSATALRHWVLALTCGANAFQQQLQREKTGPQQPMTSLIWQAARLRIFELAHVVPLHDAVALSTLGVRQLLSSDELVELESSQQQPLLFLSTA